MTSRRRATIVPRHAQAGFSLIEVLLATVLLAAGLGLAFSTLGAATKTAQRGEEMAERSERIRAAEGFIRKRLSQARSIPFAFDKDGGLPQRFVGESDRMQFVADLPDYLGRGGPYMHEFAVEENDGKRRITLALAVVQSGQTIEEDKEIPPEPLAEGVGEVKFRYRALKADGSLDEWKDKWEAVEQLPLMVEVNIADADGYQWPPLVVALRLAGSTGTL